MFRTTLSARFSSVPRFVFEFERPVRRPPVARPLPFSDPATFVPAAMRIDDVRGGRGSKLSAPVRRSRALKRFVVGGGDAAPPALACDGDAALAAQRAETAHRFSEQQLRVAEARRQLRAAKLQLRSLRQQRKAQRDANTSTA